MRSSAAVAAGTLLSRITGLLRVVVLAAAIGKESLADTYNLANITPNIVYELLVGGVLAATLVPVFVELLERRNERSTSAVFTVTMTSLALFTGATMLLSPLLAHLFVLHEHGPDRAAQLHVLTVLILCFVPQMIFYGFTTLASALLNARHRFVAAAFAPVLNNVVVIGALLVFVLRTSGRHSSITDVTRVRNDLGLLLLLGIGTTVGIVAMALVLVPAVARAGVRLRFVLSWRDPAIKTILRLSGWTAGYVVTNQLAQLFVLILANNSSGNVSAYVYAFTFYVVPHGLLAVSIMTTMTPNLARRARAGDADGLRREFGLGLRYIVVLVLPASVLVRGARATDARRHRAPPVHRARRGRHRRHAAGVRDQPRPVLDLPLRHARVLRAPGHAHPVRAERVRERRQRGARDRALLRTSGCRASRSRGAARTSSPRSSRSSCSGAGSGTSPTPTRSGRRCAPGTAAIAMAVVAAPIAGAIGRSSPASALLATAVAGAAGVLVYGAGLVLLRSDELTSLVGLVRRRTAGDTGRLTGWNTRVGPDV